MRHGKGYESLYTLKPIDLNPPDLSEVDDVVTLGNIYIGRRKFPVWGIGYWFDRVDLPLPLTAPSY